MVKWCAFVLQVFNHHIPIPHLLNAAYRIYRIPHNSPPYSSFHTKMWSKYRTIQHVAWLPKS